MKIKYQPKKLQKTVSDYNAIFKNYGTMAKKVVQRLQEMEAAQTLGDLRNIPAARCHSLSGKLSGHLAVDISGNHRIIFRPDHDPPSKKGNESYDWSQVTAITIVAIGEDYH